MSGGFMAVVIPVDFFAEWVYNDDRNGQLISS